MTFRLVVTGGSGFIGTNFVEHMAARQVEVTNLDIAPPRNPAQIKYWVRGDIRDKAQLSRVLGRTNPDALVHLAARTDLRGSSVTDYDSNTVGVQNIIQNGASRGIPTVFASSRLVFRIDSTPRHDFDYSASTPYGLSKIRGEELVRNHLGNAAPWALVRPTSIWGPWFETPYRDFFEAVMRQRFVRVPGVQVHKSFGFVGNTVHQLERILSRVMEGESGKVLWLADPEPLEVFDWADQISHELGVKRPYTCPQGVLKLAARLGSFAQRRGVWQEPPITKFRLDNLMTDMVYDVSETSRLTEVPPFTTAEGVAATVGWMRSQGLAK